jgi:hypothetical protein
MSRRGMDWDVCRHVAAYVLRASPGSARVRAIPIDNSSIIIRKRYLSPAKKVGIKKMLGKPLRGKGCL